MANLSTRFFNLNLNSPVIAASSSMTGHLEQVVKLAEAGAGAVVLKSIFEEEIMHEWEEELGQLAPGNINREYLDYFDLVIKEDNLKNYTKLISESKAATTVPIVASIHCISSHEWISYARKLEEAGADALELNLFLVPSDFNQASTYHEQFYLETIHKVLHAVRIPVGIKISFYFSNLAGFVKKLSGTGIAGITLFNRFYTPDIDIHSQTIIGSDVLSSPGDYLFPLRWTGVLSGNLDCDLAATHGIHSAETALKFILAGASAVQIASIVYTHGPMAVTKMNQGIETWMNEKGYHQLADFKGLLSLRNAANAAAYERVQFMKHFGEKSFF